MKDYYTLSMDGNELVTSIRRITPHPQFDRETLRNDIAILILETPIKVRETLL